MKATVFLGGGRITSALISGLRLAHYTQPIIVHDRHAAKLRHLRREFQVRTERDLRRAVAQAGLLIVAVRPDSVKEVLRVIGRIDRPLTVVSLAAGVPLAKLQKRLRPPVRWARAMPSPTCRTGRGFTALAFSRQMSRPERKRVLDFFAAVGRVLEVPEKKFDVFTATYSSSHGYHALAALSRAGEKLGLDRQTALAAAAHALAGGVMAFTEAKLPLEELIHEAATPGGIAAKVMKTMDEAGYYRIIERGVRAGVARARANARGV
ncbi:MAG TPA: pyrroline-5-carboxylate reductase dimerization domain-containing protein [Terriglobales bacterium]|nr:pyrroline-5-carboxylate reductase dimerization domain-containing protein [Terriglobales bacterium]